MIQFIIVSYLWIEKKATRYDLYDESSRTIEDLKRNMFCVSFYFFRLESSRHIYLDTVFNTEMIEVLWCKRSLCKIVCDLYLVDALHLSHERYIFDFEIIESSSQFIRFKNFKINDELVYKYYVNECEVVTKLLKSLQIASLQVASLHVASLHVASLHDASANDDRSLKASSRRFCLLEIVFEASVREVRDNTNRSEVENRRATYYLRQKTQKSQYRDVDWCDKDYRLIVFSKLQISSRHFWNMTMKLSLLV